MKKLSGIVILGLLLCNVAAAEIKLLERELINQGTNRSIVDIASEMTDLSKAQIIKLLDPKKLI